MPDDDDEREFDVELGDDDSGDDEWEPPTKEEWERTRSSLSKANKQAKNYRLKLRDAQRTQSSTSRSSTSSSDDSKEGKKDDSRAREQERERIRLDAETDAETKWKSKVVQNAARAALKEAGLLGDSKKLAKLVDIDEVDVDEDGEVDEDSLAEQIEQIKEDYPELFNEDRDRERERGYRRGRPASVTRIDAGNRGGGSPVRKTPASTAEQIAGTVLRRKTR
jgi:hypothetical protein